jgi:hypothetical protein
MKNNIKNFFHNYSLIFLGFLLFTLYFWNRFFRSQTSKDLPLNLSILHFFILVYVCLIFSYIVYSLLFPRKSNDLVEKFIEFLFTPIAEFDKYLKSLFSSQYKQFMKYIIPFMDFLIIQTKLFFMIFWLFPRMILLSALFIDVVWLDKLHYKYMVIYFGIMLFLYRYIKYSLKKYKTELIAEYEENISSITTPYVPKVHPAELEPDYDPNDPDEEDCIEYMSLPFKVFIEFQTKSIVYQEITRDIHSINTSLKFDEKIWKESYGFNYPENAYLYRGKIYTEHFKKTQEIAKLMIEEIVKISLLIEFYSDFTNSEKKVKKLKLYIYFNYLLCWLYVLIVSLPSLDLLELSNVFVHTWLKFQDPFTDLSIIEILFFHE